MTILILVVFLTLFISAACSLFEAVLLSTRMGALEVARTTKEKLAIRFIAMKENLSATIAAILILNTLANTAGAALSGMYATSVLGRGMVPLFSLLFTLGILVFSEITPKTIGAIHWKGLWHLIVWPITAIQVMLKPVVFVVQKYANRLTRGRPAFSITEDEILAMVRLGVQEGELSAQESLMIKNIIALEQKRARDVLTPRTVMVALDESLTVAQAADQVEDKAFSRYPVYGEDLDHITGYVILRDLFSRDALAAPDRKLKDLAKPIHFVPDSSNCLGLLTQFLRARLHIAIASDEYGGVAGLVTLEDLIEAALGTHIVDETDRIVDLQQDARKSQQEQKRS